MAVRFAFIIGVPRSGTTLLRVLLDSHSEIVAPPEAPWLTGAYGSPASLRAFLVALADGAHGPVRNVAKVAPDDVFAAGRALLERLFEPTLGGKKCLLVFKTPQDIVHLDFLTRFLPDAHFIHITRDGRDVCLSQLAKKDSFFSSLREFGRLNYANTFARWMAWEERIRGSLYRGGTRVTHVRYEDLVTEPTAVLERVTRFLGVGYEPAMLDYAAARHDFPEWEAGSQDVASFQGITPASVGRWRQVRTTPDMRRVLRAHDAFLVSLGYPSSNVASGLFDRPLGELARVAGVAADALARLRDTGLRAFRAMSRLGVGLAGLVAASHALGWYLAT